MHCASLMIILTSLAVLTSRQPSSTAPGEYRPEGSIREYFLGAWKLVATENKYPDGHTTPYPDLGSDATGFLLYTPSGHMCAQLMKPGRPRWSDDGSPTAAEAVSALDGFTSYCGTFELRESERIIIHRPETAWSPNWPGSIQKRPYHLVSQNRFFFRGLASEKQQDGTEVSVTWTITWERLK
jgi:hypothetical protein